MFEQYEKKTDPLATLATNEEVVSKARELQFLLQDVPRGQTPHIDDVRSQLYSLIASTGIDIEGVDEPDLLTKLCG